MDHLSLSPIMKIFPPRWLQYLRLKLNGLNLVNGGRLTATCIIRWCQVLTHADDVSATAVGHRSVLPKPDPVRPGLSGDPFNLVWLFGAVCIFKWAMRTIVGPSGRHMCCRVTCVPLRFGLAERAEGRRETSPLLHNKKKQDFTQWIVESRCLPSYLLQA